MSTEQNSHICTFTVEKHHTKLVKTACKPNEGRACLDTVHFRYLNANLTAETTNGRVLVRRTIPADSEIGAEIDRTYDVCIDAQAWSRIKPGAIVQLWDNGVVIHHNGTETRLHAEDVRYPDTDQVIPANGDNRVKISLAPARLKELAEAYADRDYITLSFTAGSPLKPVSIYAEEEHTTGLLMPMRSDIAETNGREWAERLKEY